MRHGQPEQPLLHPLEPDDARIADPERRAESEEIIGEQRHHADQPGGQEWPKRSRPRAMPPQRPGADDRSRQHRLILDHHRPAQRQPGYRQPASATSRHAGQRDDEQRRDRRMAQQRRGIAPDRRSERVTLRRKQRRPDTPGDGQGEIEQHHCRDGGQQGRSGGGRDPRPQLQIIDKAQVGGARHVPICPVAHHRIRHRHRRHRHQRHARRLVEIGMGPELRLVDGQRREGIDGRGAILDHPDRGEQAGGIIGVELPRAEPRSGEPDQQEQPEPEPSQALPACHSPCLLLFARGRIGAPPARQPSSSSPVRGDRAPRA